MRDQPRALPGHNAPFDFYWCYFFGLTCWQHWATHLHDL